MSEDDPHVGSKHVAYWKQPCAIKVVVLDVPFFRLIKTNHSPPI